MADERYIFRGGTKLRCGYTTGSCAAMASAAACDMLLSQKARATASLVTPRGIRVEADVEAAEFAEDHALCAVRKDAGDDCDATDKMLIFARAERIDSGIEITGGPGIGRVTRPGLDQPVGEYAINSTPRQLIAGETARVCGRYNYTGGIKITIYAPGGEEAAKRTFNPRLGIEGGISILGTSGIVEPQSARALIDSIGLEMGQRAAQGHRRLMLAPGNYAERYIAGSFPEWDIPVVKCSNYIGEALDFAAAHRFEEVLLVSHIGKAVKLAGGIMDTHSRAADCRAELFAAHAACCGAGAETVRAVMGSAVTESCLEILRGEGLLEDTVRSLLSAMQLHLDRRAAGAFSVGAAVFQNGGLPLGDTEGAKRLIAKWRAEGRRPPAGK